MAEATYPFRIGDTLKQIRKTDVNADGNTYYGVANAGASTAAAVWQIERQSASGTVTSFLWADGDINFDNVWDNRTALSYS